MIKKLIILFFIAIFSNTVIAKEPPNLSLVKQTLVRYHDSGQYDYDISKAGNQAKYYLEKRINNNKLAKNQRKLAIVVDVDDTAISTYGSMLKDDFAGTAEILNARLNRTNLLAIPETLKLCNFAEKNRVAVFFLTGRKESFRANTIKELEFAGYHGWDGLFMRDNIYFKSPAAVFKSAVRKKIENKGYDIVINIGDQYSDLAGGFAEHAVKLPNPYYFVP
jgi:predicted secreted acid phosphatase